MSFLRPDERTSQSQIESSENFNRKVKSVAKTGLGAGLVGLSSKLAPFLSEYIPTDLALKGISKISPKVGEFLQRGNKLGLNIKDGLDFLKEQIEPKSPKPLAKASSGKQESYFRQVFQFLKSGKSIGQGVKTDKFLKIAKNFYDNGLIKTEEDLKNAYDHFTEDQSGQQKKAEGPIKSLLNLEKQQQQPQQPQQQSGKGQQALTQALQELKKIRGG